MAESNIANIEVRGAKSNNLKNIDVDIPLNSFVAITGVSGSGKSSLAMDTLYAEGARRYLNALATYTRRRIAQVGRSDVKEIKNLPSAIALRQRPEVPSIRSTVGTLTEVLNIVRLIFSRLGSHVCPNGHRLPPMLEVAEVMDYSGTDERMGMIVCPTCKVEFMAPGAENFAFNSDGACPTCDGTGEIKSIVEDKLIDENLSISEGAVKSWKLPGRGFMPQVVEQLGVRLDVPFKNLNDTEKEIVLHGPEEKRDIVVPTSTGKAFALNANYENAYIAVEHSLKNAKNERSVKRLNRFYDNSVCPTCHGSRFNPEILKSKVMDLSIAEVSNMDIEQLKSWSNEVKTWVPENMRKLASKLIEELLELLDPIFNLGLDYLTLNRAANTLSTGELQRIQLARTIRNEMTGILYILDEPSVGLHADNVKGLIEIIKKIVNQGNTVVVVDHDTSIIKEADYIIEVGPDSGKNGGRIISQGIPSEIINNKNSVIAPFLDGTATIVGKKYNDSTNDEFGIEVKNKNNIKDIKAKFYKNQLNVVSGLSGSGKTTLIMDSLLPALKKDSDNLSGDVDFKKIVEIDSKQIGKNVRSTIATYTDIMSKLRKIYSEIPQAKDRKYTIANFSYNNSVAACDYCGGTGEVTLDVQYLPDITEICPVCHGKRYKPEILDIKYREQSIADILDMTVENAEEFFKDESGILSTLVALEKLGLGYLKLGESTPRLSGGESQRLKLATYFQSKPKNYLFIFDEPTVGLHPRDVQNLISVMNTLIDGGATIIVIEHDLEFIANADNIVDMGPRGGRYGGRIVAMGSVDEICKSKESITGQYLAELLNNKK